MDITRGLNALPDGRFHRFSVPCSVAYNTGPFLNRALAYYSGFGSLTTLLLLSGGPAYAEWLWFNEDKPGMTIYVNPDTIRRKGDLVKMWALYDFETAEHVADTFIVQDAT